MLLLFPTHYLSHPSGSLVGWKSSDGAITCVVCIIPEFQASELPQELATAVGLWSNGNSDECPRIERETSLVLRKNKGSDLPEVYSESGEVVFLLYDQPARESFLTDQLIELMPTRTSQNGDIAASIKLPEMPEWQGVSHVNAVLQFINNTRENEIAIKSQISQEQEKSSTKCYLTILRVAFCIASATNALLGFITSLSSCGVFQTQIMQYLLSLPVILQQFKLRIAQVKYLVGYMVGYLHEKLSVSDKKMKSNTLQELKSSNEQSKVAILHQRVKNQICIGNFVMGGLLDVILGTVIVFWLNSSNSIEPITMALLENTDYIAQLLSSLLHWMTGVPAGLKLNTQLAEFLRKFFLYHIYLWQTYLKTIQPYLQTILWVSMLSGCFGLSFLVSLASDVFSILTIHIYCFYVYAARLYSLQVYGMTSLARLFTGKKQNILRGRVDSLPHDIDRLFAGTLLFTILFFLLPTTAVFYVVYTSLRLMALVIKALLAGATHALNKMPLFGLALFCCKPTLLPGGLQLDILKFQEPKSEGLQSPFLPPLSTTLHVKLCNKPLSLSKLFNWSLGDGENTKPEDTDQQTWGALVGRLLKGRLIYPWIKRE